MSLSSSEWDAWKARFGKNYSQREDAFRKTIFEKRLRDITSFNDKSTFKKGLNKFSDWTDFEREKYLNRGARSDPEPVTKCVNFTDSGHQPQEKRDWRHGHHPAVTSIKDQGIFIFLIYKNDLL